MAAAEELRVLLPGRAGLTRLDGWRRQRTARPRHPSMIKRPDECRRSPWVKIRLERDVLAEAVQWAARSLPVRPSVPILAGLLRPRRRRGRDLLQLRLRDLGPDQRQGPGHRRGSGADLRPAAGRDLPQPAQQAGRSQRRRHQDGTGLRQRPLHPADPAGRRLPVAAVDAADHRHRAERRIRPGGRPGRGRRRPRRTAARLHRHPGRDRGRPGLPAGHRPLPDGAQGTDLESDLHPDLGHRAGPGQGAQRHRPLDDRRRRGLAESGQWRQRRRDHRLRGPRRRPASGRPPPGCWTASSPRSGTS